MPGFDPEKTDVDVMISPIHWHSRIHSGMNCPVMISGDHSDNEVNAA